MSAPYKRFSIPGGLGTQQDRIRKLESGHIDLADDANPWWPARTGYSPFLLCDDSGTDPSGIGVSFGSSLVQQQVWTTQLVLYATGIWTSGTGTTYLLALNEWANNHVTFVSQFGIYLNPPLGSGYCWDSSTDTYEHIFFRGSDQSTVDSNNYNCLEMVLDDGSLVGPGNPFTWAVGDIICAGTITMQVALDEELPEF